MKNLARFFAVFWVLGTVLLFLQGQESFFKVLGVTKVDVFNSPSLRSVATRLVYYRMEENEIILLPFMHKSGENLSWFLNENFKYRAYLLSAFTLKKRYLLRPLLYDFCRNDFQQKDYVLEVYQNEKLLRKEQLPLSMNNFAVHEKNICEEIKRRNSYLPSLYQSILLKDDAKNQGPEKSSNP